MEKRRKKKEDRGKTKGRQNEDSRELEHHMIIQRIPVLILSTAN